MAKQIPDQAKASYKMALERARKHPSQIVDIEAIANNVEKEMQTPDFSVRAELYKLLTEVSEEGRSNIINLYRHGLQDAAREGQIKLQKVWDYFFNGERVQHVLFDKNYAQLVVSTSSREEARHSAVYAIGLRNGKKNWLFPMKKMQNPTFSTLSESAVYFINEYAGENENHHHTASLYGLSLKNGGQVMKWLPEGKDDGGVMGIRGIFGNLIFVNDEWSSRLHVLNTETQKEEWRVSGSIRTSLDDGFLASNKRELIWLNKNGLPQKTLKLPFPKKDKGNIHGCLVSDDKVYLAVYYHWETYNKDFSVCKQHDQIIFHAVGKRDGKILWSFTPTEQMSCSQIIHAGNHIYFCDNDKTIVLEQANGKFVGQLPYNVLHVKDSLVFHTDAKNRFNDDGFTFYARETETSAIKWQRKNFRFITAKNGLLFGGVGNTLVILDEVTGKERSSVQLDSEPSCVDFIANNSFWVTTWKGKTVAVFRMGDAE